MIIKENNQKAFLFGLTILIFFFQLIISFSIIFMNYLIHFKQIYFYNILILILLTIISHFYKKLFIKNIFEILFILSVFFGYYFITIILDK